MKIETLQLSWNIELSLSNASTANEVHRLGSVNVSNSNSSSMLNAIFPRLQIKIDDTYSYIMLVIT